MWRYWKKGKGLEIADPVIVDWSSSTFRPHEILRCIQIGLLCVQESADDRPMMSSVVLMFGSETRAIFLLTEYPGPTEVVQTETEVSMDAARTSPCGSPCNGLRSRMLQPTSKFRSGQGSNPGADTPAAAPIPPDQSNLVETTAIPQPKTPGFCAGKSPSDSKQREYRSWTVNQITLSILDAR